VKDAATAQHQSFHIQSHRQRASLLLVDGVIKLAFASRCEDGPAADKIPPFHGWIFAYDAETLDQVGSYNVTPTSAGGGIWQGAGGLAADDAGRVYFITGNIQGNFGADRNPDRAGVNLGNSFVRLDSQVQRNADATVHSVKLAVGSWFTPYRAAWQNEIDLDLGSSGPVLIPGTNYVVGGGKEGIVYLLDRDNLGGFNAVPASALPPKCSGQPPAGYCATFIPNDPQSDRALSSVSMESCTPGSCWTMPGSAGGSHSALHRTPSRRARPWQR
jgi:hypothetical protein